jgi:hypothetical protein
VLEADPLEAVGDDRVSICLEPTHGLESGQVSCLVPVARAPVDVDAGSYPGKGGLATASSSAVSL